MARRYQFKNANILLLDPDRCIAQAILHNLRALGFTRVTHVATGAQALRLLNTHSINFMITEWEVPDMNGIDLVRHIRTDTASPNRALPIIMLTGRGELPDVKQSRDAGITEFVVKPFSPHTLFSRIEQMVDNPRGFVVSKRYIGPERRRRNDDFYQTRNRRVVKPVVVVDKSAIKAEPDDTPKVVAPDYSLKQAMGITEPLSRIITPELLREAQRELDGLKEASLQWILRDITALQEGLERLCLAYSIAALETIKSAALSIKSRSGTFGYALASDVARSLYLFLCADFIPTHPHHLTVIAKHIEVLQVIFAHKIEAREGLGEELLVDLQRLIVMKR